MPEIAAGFGAPTLAEATSAPPASSGGKMVGYVNAHCAGGRLQVDGTLSFTNGDLFPDDPDLAMPRPRLRSAALLCLLAWRR